MRGAFPYLGSVGTIAPSLIGIINLTRKKLDARRYVDPFAGGCVLPYELAKSKVPLALSDLNFYSAVNASSIFSGALTSRGEAKSGQGMLSRSGFGYWSMEYREFIDGALIRAPSQWDPRVAACSRVLLNSTFRGVGWASSMSDGRQVNTLTEGDARAHLEAALRTIDRKSRPTELRISNLAADQFLEDTVRRGDLVFLDPPFPTSALTAVSTTGTIYEWYDELNKVLLQRSTVPSPLFDSSSAHVSELISLCKSREATVILLKQSNGNPPSSEFISLYGAPQFQLPLRGKRGASVDMSIEREEVWVI